MFWNKALSLGVYSLEDSLSYIFLKENVLFNYEIYKRIQDILKDDLSLFKEYATIPARFSVIKHSLSKQDQQPLKYFYLELFKKNNWNFYY